MSAVDGGYLLPEEIDPQRIQFCIEIPDDINHITAFWGALTELTYWWNWQRDDDHTAAQVIRVWQDVISKAHASYLAGNCISPEICQSYRPTSARLTWFPENPYHPEPEVPDGYTYHPFTIVDNSILGTIVGMWGLGYKVGDVYTDFTKLPAFSGWDDILTNLGNMPSVTIGGLHGTGTVKLHLLNIPQGGRALIQVDNAFNPLNLQLVELNKDIVSFPQETQVPIVIEVEIEDDGDHEVKVSFLPTVDDTFLPIFFGGGFRGFELCGFGREGCNCMDEECCDALISGQSTTNELLTKIISMFNDGFKIVPINGNTTPPDTGGGECAPDHFDHNGDDEDETALAQRAQALCATVQRYIKGVLLGALRDMGAPQFLIDYILAEIVTDIPLSLTNLTVSYPLSFSGLGVFFAIASAAFSFDALTCLMVAGLSGDKNNTSSNFKESIPEVTEGLDALLVPLAALLRATNQKTENYKAFNLALNDANDEDLSEFECPCEDEPTGDCGEAQIVDNLRPSTVITHITGNIYHVQQNTPQMDGQYYADIDTDIAGLFLDIKVPDDTVTYPFQAVANYQVYEVDDTTLRSIGTGGFLPVVNVGRITFSTSDPMDTYVDVTCHEE